MVKENPQHWTISKEWLLVYSEQQKRQGNIIKFANKDFEGVQAKHFSARNQAVVNNNILVMFSVK